MTNGKGGVGKTSVVVNVAVALAQLGHRVAILDADFGLGNVDILLGVASEWHLGHFLGGERTDSRARAILGFDGRRASAPGWRDP